MAERSFAVLGLFDSPDALLDAVRRLRGTGLGRLQAYSPYPVHGLDRELGLRRSPLGGMVFIMGLLGALTAFAFQYWMSAVDYPIVTGGKSAQSWQAFVPIMFEVMVLFATLTAGLGMLLLLNRLPDLFHPLLSSKSIAALTRDKFALALEGAAEGVPTLPAREALAAAGALAIEVLPLPETPPPPSLNLLLALAAAGAAVCAAAGLGTYWAVKLYPVLPPMSHMEDQPRLSGQRPSRFFRDGRAVRPAPEGSVARGRLPYLIKTPEEAGRRLKNPLPATREVMLRGQKLYGIYCTPCHGARGNGTPTLSSAYGAKPADLRMKRLAQAPDGELYHTIVLGRNAMPSYAPDLSEDERWAVIRFLRALQRAQDAEEGDLP